MDNEITIEEEEEDYNDAYLLAASFFLNSWPSDWTADRLSMAMMAFDDPYMEDQESVKIWPAIQKFAESQGEDPMVFTENLIFDLADTMVIFKRRKRNSKKSEEKVDSPS
jgi:hypothetical protein